MWPQQAVQTCQTCQPENVEIRWPNSKARSHKQPTVPRCTACLLLFCHSQHFTTFHADYESTWHATLLRSISQHPPQLAPGMQWVCSFRRWHQGWAFGAAQLRFRHLKNWHDNHDITNWFCYAKFSSGSHVQACIFTIFIPCHTYFILNFADDQTTPCLICLCSWWEWGSRCLIPDIPSVPWGFDPLSGRCVDWKAWKLKCSSTKIWTKRRWKWIRVELTLNENIWKLWRLKSSHKEWYRLK
jgi:hypothetical protein